MRRTLLANSSATARSLLGAFEVQPELARVAEVHVLRLDAVRRIAVDEHADHARQRTWHRDLARAQQRHAAQAHAARGHGGELGVEGPEERGDAAKEVVAV